MASRRIFSIALVATFITAAAAPASASPSAQLRCTELLTALHDEIASGKLPPGKILTLGPGARAPVIYFTDLNKRDEFAAARNLHEPILILHGRRDYQVTERISRSGAQT